LGEGFIASIIGDMFVHYALFRSRRLATGARSSKPNPSRCRASCSTGAAELVIGLVIPLVIVLVI
jgi:hypothetical protein